MRIFSLICCMLLMSTIIAQEEASINSPDGKLEVSVKVENGKPFYSVTYNEKVILEKSPLGLVTNAGDFTSKMKLLEASKGTTSSEYNIKKIKQSHVS